MSVLTETSTVASRAADLLRELGRCKMTYRDLGSTKICLHEALALAEGNTELEGGIRTSLSEETTRFFADLISPDHTGRSSSAICGFNNRSTDEEVFALLDEAHQVLSS